MGGRVTSKKKTCLLIAKIAMTMEAAVWTGIMRKKIVTCSGESVPTKDTKRNPPQIAKVNATNIWNSPNLCLYPLPNPRIDIPTNDPESNINPERIFELAK